MKRVLMVSYVFPPMAAVGGQRVLYFCKHLPRFGWEPVVLTTRNAANVSLDPTLLEKAPDTRIYRAPTWEPLLRRDLARPERRTAASSDVTASTPPDRASVMTRIKKWIRLILSVPDHAIFWVPAAILKGLGVIAREKPDAIFSSSPPVSSHIVASILSRLTGRPHLVDFRDLWTLNHLYHQRGYPGIFRRYDRFWEKLVLRRASAIVTASPGFTRQLEEHLAGGDQRNRETITNGFDYDEVAEIKPRPGESDVFRFAYIGSLYADFNPEFFFRALAAWLKQDGIDHGRVSVDFYGNTGFDYSDWLRESGLDDVVTFHGFRSRSALLPILIEVDCLLLFLGFQRTAANVIPAKLFEYLASGTPILAVTPEGVTSELIERHRAGVWIDQPDEGRMVALLREIYRQWQETGRVDRRYKYIAEIDRTVLTRRLADVLDDLTKDE